MDFRSKVILVNAGILVGLVLQLVRGRPVPAILLAGLVLVLVFNGIMFFSSRTRTASRRP